MSAEKTIELSPEALKIIADLGSPEWMLRAIATVMDRENQLTIGNIQKAHLTGKGPFPPEEHRLGVRTNRLRSSVTASGAAIVGERVESAIGSNVKYAAVHEFGRTIHHQARAGSVRLRTDAKGNLLGQRSNGKLAVFAKKGHKRAVTRTYQAGAYDVEMPERAPFRTGIEERLPAMGRAISEGVVEVFHARGDQA
jgi:hypothetical protein